MSGRQRRGALVHHVNGALGRRKDVEDDLAGSSGVHQRVTMATVPVNRKRGRQVRGGGRDAHEGGNRRSVSYALLVHGDGDDHRARREGGVEPCTPLNVFHGVGAEALGRGRQRLRGGEPPVQCTVVDFTDGVFVEFDVGFPFGDVFDVAPCFFPLNGGLCVSIAAFKERHNGLTFVRQRSPSLRAS